MENNIIDELLLANQRNFGYVENVEFRSKLDIEERCFDLWIVLKCVNGKRLTFYFNDIDRLTLKQPFSSTLTLNLNIAKENAGPYRVKKYYHVSEVGEGWIDFYCTDFQYDLS